MKKVTMFTMESCPYCKQAHKWMKELFEAYPQYSAVPVEIIDEVQNPDIANQYDYYYVPTYYAGNEKVHEGVASYDIIFGVFDKALKDL